MKTGNVLIHVENSGPTDEVETSGQNTGTFKGRNVWQIRHIVHFDVKYQEYFQRHLRQHPTLIKRTPEGSGNLTEEPLLSEVLSRTAASVLCCKSRWIRDGINPCLIPPLFPLSFFTAEALAMALERQLPWTKLRTVHWGQRKCECQRTIKVLEELGYGGAAKRRGGRKTTENTGYTVYTLHIR